MSKPKRRRRGGPRQSGAEPWRATCCKAATVPRRSRSRSGSMNCTSCGLASGGGGSTFRVECTRATARRAGAPACAPVRSACSTRNRRSRRRRRIGRRSQSSVRPSGPSGWRRTGSEMGALPRPAPAATSWPMPLVDLANPTRFLALGGRQGGASALVALSAALLAVGLYLAIPRAAGLPDGQHRAHHVYPRAFGRGLRSCAIRSWRSRRSARWCGGTRWPT